MAPMLALVLVGGSRSGSLFPPHDGVRAVPKNADLSGSSLLSRPGDRRRRHRTAIPGQRQGQSVFSHCWLPEVVSPPKNPAAFWCSWETWQYCRSGTSRAHHQRSAATDHGSHAARWHAHRVVPDDRLVQPTPTARVAGRPDTERGILPSVSHESSSAVRSSAWMAAWLSVCGASFAGRRETRRMVRCGSQACCWVRALADHWTAASCIDKSSANELPEVAIRANVLLHRRSLVELSSISPDSAACKAFSSLYVAPAALIWRQKTRWTTTPFRLLVRRI
jgi:hypothetical protein